MLFLDIPAASVKQLQGNSSKRLIRITRKDDEDIDDEDFEYGTLHIFIPNTWKLHSRVPFLILNTQTNQLIQRQRWLHKKSKYFPKKVRSEIICFVFLLFGCRPIICNAGSV